MPRTDRWRWVFAAAGLLAVAAGLVVGVWLGAGTGVTPPGDNTVPADAAYARSQGAAIDGDLAPGERVGPLVVLGVPGKSPGEVAFHWPERRILIVGDAIIGNPPGACGFLREKVMDDPPRLRASVRELLALDFDVLLVGDGTSILSGAKERVAALCASVPS